VSRGYQFTTHSLSCHTLAQSLGTPGNAPIASMPAAGRPHYILRARDLECVCVCLLLQDLVQSCWQNTAFVFGLCRWSANFGLILVIYFRIAQNSCSKLACAGLLHPTFPPWGGDGRGCALENNRIDILWVAERIRSKGLATLLVLQCLC
jgi:hypothetical protein